MNLMHSNLLQNIKSTYECTLGYMFRYIFNSLFMGALVQILLQNHKVDVCNKDENYSDCGKDNDDYYSDDSNNYNGDENGNGKDFWMEASVPQLIHYSLPAVTCPIVSMF